MKEKGIECGDWENVDLKHDLVSEKIVFGAGFVREVVERCVWLDTRSVLRVNTIEMSA